MSREHFHELSDRLSGVDGYLELPQLFLHGQLLGVSRLKLRHHFRLNVQDSSVVERLNETGQLRALLKPLQVCYTISFTSFTSFKHFQAPVSIDNVCVKCGGFGMIPCPLCGGSKKSGLISRLNINTVMLRCAHCDQGGLARCDLC